MPKLVVLSEGLTGRAHELKAEKTTIGRVEDNTFQIPHPSVSSHHAEILLRGSEVVVRDLDSTNGSFIADKQITEAVLKPSQVLRLGQVEIRLEADPATGPKTKMVLDHTQIVQPGIKRDELDQTVRIPAKPSTGFEKKSNKGPIIFIGIAVLVVVIIIVVLVVVLHDTGGT